MPPTNENIADRPGFDVYGAMLVLSFLAALGAAWLMRQELVDNYGWNIDKNSPEFKDQAVHITEINKDPQKYPEIVQLTETDQKEWEFIKGKGTVFPVKDFKWPEGYDPLEHAVKPLANNLELQGLEALMKSFQPPAEGVAPAEKPAEPAPVEKKEDKPAEPAPAPKTEEAKKE
jgi:hypothetical protein